MISMEMMGKIRRRYFRDKLSLHEIAKRTRLSRNTIRKWVRMPATKAAGLPAARGIQQAQSLSRDLGAGTAGRCLQREAESPNAKAFLSMIRAQGYDGCYSQLTTFLRH